MDNIDFRSDTVTKPVDKMRTLMADSEVGDDVYGEDPTVNELEAYAAELTGSEAALFASSGTQSNLIALLTHCQRGDEYIVGQQAHTYKYEGGGAAVLGSIQPQPLDFETDGTLDLSKVSETIKPDDIHFARTVLLCIENTHNGIALPFDYMKKAKEFSMKNNLKLHLDGARIFNAAVKYKTSIEKITTHFDSVSICLSKGLGAPVGSILCGSRDFINEGRRWRKVLGGGMRQAGVIASAGLYALENHIDRLEEDHENSSLLAKELNMIDPISVNHSDSQTNMVFMEIDKKYSSELIQFLGNRGILIQGNGKFRLVTHLNITKSDILKTVAAFKDFFIDK